METGSLGIRLADPLLGTGLSTSDTVVVAPHADDAALSLGVLLSARALPGQITLVTVFSQSGFSVAGFRGDPATVSASRASEDAAFAACIGARVRALGFLDAPLRDPTTTLAGLLDPGRPLDGDLVGAVSRAIGGQLPSRSTTLVGPAGLGNHIDHRTVAAAVSHLPCPARLCYADQPYTLEVPATRPAPSPCAVVHATESAIRRKRRHLSLYPSQPAPARLLTLLGRPLVTEQTILEQLWPCDIG